MLVKLCGIVLGQPSSASNLVVLNTEIASETLAGKDQNDQTLIGKQLASLKKSSTF